MQKRSESKKRVKNCFRIKLRNITMIVFCIAFAFSAVYAVDISTNRLMNYDDGSYAIRIAEMENGMLRFDLVGRQYNLNLSVIEYNINKAVQTAKNFWSDIITR